MQWVLLKVSYNLALCNKIVIPGSKIDHFLNNWKFFIKEKPALVRKSVGEDWLAGSNYLHSLILLFLFCFLFVRGAVESWTTVQVWKSYAFYIFISASISSKKPLLSKLADISFLLILYSASHKWDSLVPI